MLAALRRNLLWVVLGLVVLLAIGGPYVVWWLQKTRTLAVVVVDKTVPFEKYREHSALAWILHALKITTPDGRELDPARDYVGYDPKTRVGHDLTAALLAKADVLVVTDTYGVYQGDYARPGDIAALEHSPKIYGGLSDDEAAVIEDFAARGGLLIAEFNTFASPTSPAARDRMERLLGVRWSRWVARYWADLQDPNEVPGWVATVWERVTHKAFDLRGGGLVFVREDEDIVVLLDGVDLGPRVITQERTAAGAALGLPVGGGFRFWMDVIVAEGADVLHEHVVDALGPGLAKLAAHGLFPRFPALTKRRDLWYFAGDFVDQELDLGSPIRAGLLPWRARTSGWAGAPPEETYFWRFYAPIVSGLLASRAH